MSMNVGTSSKLNSDINVTPLVDVVLVLLIIFMVVTPLVQRGYDIDIPPEATQTIPQDTMAQQVILAVTEEDCPGIAQPLGAAGLPPSCYVRVNKDRVALGALAGKMNDVFKNRRQADKVLFLAAQDRINYEAIVQILDLARTQVSDLKVGIVTDERIATSAAQGGE